MEKSISPPPHLKPLDIIHVRGVYAVLQLHCVVLEIRLSHTPLPSHTHRAQKQRLWEKSCKWIATHESRVRVETRRMAGEDFEVWMWIQVSGGGEGGGE